VWYRFGEILSLFRGLRPRYDITRKLQELGRPCKLWTLVKRGTPPELMPYGKVKYFFYFFDFF
jgi:hypothetical protein